MRRYRQMAYTIKVGVAMLLAVATAVACSTRSKDPRSPDAPSEDGAAVPDTGDSGGTRPAPPPNFSAGCPTGPYAATFQGDYQPHWQPLLHPLTGGVGPVLVDVDLLAYPSPWGSIEFGVWTNRTDPHGYGDSVNSSFGGTLRMSLTPHDAAGQVGDTLVCDLQYDILEDFYVELSTNPGYLGDRQLHFVLDGGQLFDDATDVYHCNQPLSDMGVEDDETDYIMVGETPSGLAAFPMSQEEGALFSLHPGPQIRTLYITDYGDGELEDDDLGLPYESEVRVYIYGELVHTERARIPRGQAWEVGTADLGLLEFEPAEPGEFVAFSGFGWCD